MPNVPPRLERRNADPQREYCQNLQRSADSSITEERA
jgi:hypothetical protein